jgi:hypothetical protein
VDEKRIDPRGEAPPDPAAGASGDIGQHCGLKRLVAYRQGTLPAAERESVQEHLSLCPRCTRLLLEVRDFEASAARGESGPLRQEAWDSLARRLPAAPAIRPLPSAGRHPGRRRLPRFVMGAAAALLLAVVGFSVWAAVTVLRERHRLARLEQRLEEREAALAALRGSLAEAERQLAVARGQIRKLAKQEIDRRPEREEELEARVAELSAELAELRRSPAARGGADRIAAASRELDVAVAPRFVLRGQEAPDAEFLRGGGVVNPVRKPPRQDRFTVALSLADGTAYEEYRLELIDREGKRLWAGRRPGSALLGDAGTSLSIRGLGPGLYRLRIQGLRRDHAELVAEYLLDVVPG